MAKKDPLLSQSGISNNFYNQQNQNETKEQTLNSIADHLKPPEPKKKSKSHFANQQHHNQESYASYDSG